MKRCIVITKLGLKLQLDDFLPTRVVLKLFVDDKTVKIYQSTSFSKIFRKLKANNFQKGVLKMSYGQRKTIQGKIEEFDNETVLLSKKELIQAYYAFLGN